VSSFKFQRRQLLAAAAAAACVLHLQGQVQWADSNLAGSHISVWQERHVLVPLLLLLFVCYGGRAKFSGLIAIRRAHGFLSGKSDIFSSAAAPAVYVRAVMQGQVQWAYSRSASSRLPVRQE
jgi:hypothetical protein